MAVGRVLVPLAICCGLIFSLIVLRSQQARQRAASSVADIERVKRGEAVFSRHCPICHLGRPSAENPFIGKNLRGILKNAKPERETAVQESIEKGSDRMPGFRYTLTPAQIEDLMAYLKTYN